MRLADVSVLNLSSLRHTAGRRLAQVPQVRQKGLAQQQPYYRDVRASCVRTGMTDQAQAIWECEFVRNSGGAWAVSRELDVQQYDVTCEGYGSGAPDAAAHIVAGSCRVEFTPTPFWTALTAFLARCVRWGVASACMILLMYGSYMYEYTLIKRVV